MTYKSKEKFPVWLTTNEIDDIILCVKTLKSMADFAGANNKKVKTIIAEWNSMLKNLEKAKELGILNQIKDIQTIKKNSEKSG